MKRVVLLGVVGLWLGGCPQVAEPCPTSYCSSHGTCTERDAIPTCVCEAGYEGLNCSTCATGFHRVGLATCAPDETCDGEFCNARGTCSLVNNERVCTCDRGYDGPACASCYPGFEDVSDAGVSLDAGLPATCALAPRCTPGTCGAGFTCDDSLGVLSCTCTDCPLCAATTCGAFGQCDMNTGRTRCTCQPGFSGPACERCDFGFHRTDAGVCTQDEQCVLTSCSGAGTCALLGGEVTCTCETGFEGDACERCATGFHRDAAGRCVADVSCSPTSCSAGATCVEVQGVTTCPCRPGFAGTTCSSCYPGYHAEPDAGCALDQRCTATSCGGGRCEDATGTVVCSQCPTGFTGAHCEVNINDCGTACATGQCVDLIGSRVCLCTDGTYGQSCLPGPTITALTPSSGPRLGGTVVQITGTGFVGGTTVTVGGVPVSLSGQTTTTLTFTTPSVTTEGARQVLVRTPNGQLANSTFTYGPLAFAYTGALQSFTVPAGVTSITVTAWGAAGGAGAVAGVRGGAGGFARGTVPVTPGQTLRVLVGQGGDRWAPLSSDGGVLPADAGVSSGGAGGGLSGVFTPSADGGVSQATALVIAGGGGGGGLFDNVTFGASGGNGGGAFGADGAQAGTTSFAARGLGGSPQAGGVGGCSTSASMAQCGQTGLPLQGGGGGVGALQFPRRGATFGGGGGAGTSSSSVAGGGGGGYFGGGGGANETPQGGGGGSGFLASAATDGVLTRGTTPGIPAGQTEPGYRAGIAVGGDLATSAAGGPGLVLISF